MATSPPRRPSLPATLYEPSTMATLVFLLYAPLLYAAPAFLAYVVASSAMAIALKVLAVAPLVVVAAYGLQLMGFVGHEGLHLSLVRSKVLSATLGVVYASTVTSYFEMGFALQHWNHHRFTNQASDLDIRQVQHLPRWWQRVLFSRAIYNIAYFKRTVRTALGRPLDVPYRLPLAASTTRALCWLNLACGAAWTAMWLVIAWTNPLLGVISIGLPMATVLVLAGCQTYIDHAGLGDDVFHNAWSRTSPLMTAVYFGANHHLEHHLYPGVPCYRLPEVHRRLRDSGFYDSVRPPIQPSFLASYLRIASPYVNGAADSAFDPLVPATSSTAPATSEQTA